MLGFQPLDICGQRPCYQDTLVTSIFNITWCTRSSWKLAYEFLIVVKTGLISKSFSKEMKSCLNSDPLSNKTLRGRGYLHSHVLLNNWLTLADDLYMYSWLPAVTSSRSNVGISKVSNQPVAWSIIATQFKLKFVSNDSATWLMFSYRLAIWTYQVLVRQIPWF